MQVLLNPHLPALRARVAAIDPSVHAKFPSFRSALAGFEAMAAVGVQDTFELADMIPGNPQVTRVQNHAGWKEERIRFLRTREVCAAAHCAPKDCALSLPSAHIASKLA